MDAVSLIGAHTCDQTPAVTQRNPDYAIANPPDIEYLKESFAGWYIFQIPIASNINDSY